MLIRSRYGTPYFIAEADVSRPWLERQRWPEGPVCAHCGFRKAYPNKAKPGYYRCARPRCRKDFTVLTGTLMERSHIPIDKWLGALWWAAFSDEKITAEDLQRELSVSYKTAWYLAERVADVKQRTRLARKPKGDRRRPRPSEPAFPVDDSYQPVLLAVETGNRKPKPK